MAITVKKSAAPRTLRVSPRAGAASLSSQNPDFTAVPSELDLARLRPKRSYTADIVLSIIACLVFIALLVVQYIEWDYFNQPPNAFPPFGTQEPLTLTQQWGAAPLGIQIAIGICAAMIVVTIAGIISAIVKKSKAKAELA